LKYVYDVHNTSNNAR